MVIALLLHWFIVSLLQCFITSMFDTFNVWSLQCLIPLMFDHFNVLPLRCFIASMFHCFDVSSLWCFIALIFHPLVVSSFWCIIASMMNYFNVWLPLQKGFGVCEQSICMQYLWLNHRNVKRCETNGRFFFNEPCSLDHKNIPVGNDAQLQ
jgi:hypothetical protein